ncbi:MAG TPA: hypothetical protein VME17_14590 [Bryobacteraceae bacterium]|nr:hypothetical protein [Bryobacteraceae bacterium]
MNKKDAQWNYRLQGIAAALGELAGAHMEPDLAMMVLKSLGLSITELQAAGADPHDLQPLKETDPVRYALADAALRFPAK